MPCDKILGFFKFDSEEEIDRSSLTKEQKEHLKQHLKARKKKNPWEKPDKGPMEVVA